MYGAAEGTGRFGAPVARKLGQPKPIAGYKYGVVCAAFRATTRATAAAPATQYLKCADQLSPTDSYTKTPRTTWPS